MSDAPGSTTSSGLEFFTLQDYARVLSRRKWFIILVTFGFAVVAAVVIHFLPNSYKATTVILVDPQKVPDYYVNSTVSTSVVDRLATLRQQILSETRLGQIIDEMGLYPDLKNKLPQEELVQRMQKDILVDAGNPPKTEKTLQAFSISYFNSNPNVAAQVTNRLASLFIEENIKGRQQAVQGTADFLTKELDDAQKELKDKEAQITSLKSHNLAELPESEPTDVQALTSLQIQLQSERDAISQAQQQQVYLQSMLGDNPAIVNLDSQQSAEADPMQTQLAQLESELDDLRKRYGPSFPDVVKKEMQIRDLQSRIAEAQKQAGSKPAPKPAPARSRNPVVESQLAKLDDVIHQHEQRQKQIEDQIAVRQSHLERIPLFQQRMSAVMRDYQAAQDHYKYLFERKFSADMATDLEVRQKGERFEVLDPAQVPYKPDHPNRPLFNLVGLGVGLLVALASALARELLDTSVKTEREVISELGAPIFGEIPWLPTPPANRQRFLHTVYACVGTSALVSAYLILVVWTWH
jgi:polysaccharide chain length determinant protein (PEP-CTERM system associated)